MPRLRRLLQTGRVFFVTANLQRGQRPLVPKERDLVCQAIHTVRQRRGFRLPGFVVMPNHVHLLVLPAADDTVSALVQGFKYVGARKVNPARRRTGPLWQKGFFDRFMRTPKELLETLEYIHQNPVRKGLVSNPERWRWSSASAYAGREYIIPVDILVLPAQPEKRFR